MLRSPEHTGGPGTPFSPIGANAIWDQHCRFLGPSRDGQIDGNFETRIVRIHEALYLFPGTLRLLIMYSLSDYLFVNQNRLAIATYS